MKKIFSIIFGLLSVTLFSQGSLVSNQVNSGSISNTSATLSCGLYGAVGTNYKIRLKRGLYGSLVATDSIVRTGAGFTTVVDVVITTTGLTASTSYYYEWELVNPTTGAVIMTTSSNYYFTTKTTATNGTINSASVYPTVGGFSIIVSNNRNGNTSTLVAYANESTYSGTGWQYTSTSKNLPGDYTTTNDTVWFTSMNNVSHNIQVRLIPASGAIPTTYNTSGTPLAGIRPTVYSVPTVNYRYDTMQIVTYTNQSGGGNDTGFIRIYDSVNTIVFTSPKKRVNDQLITGYFANYFNGVAYTPGKLFTIEQVVFNTTGRDSIKTTQYRMLAAPAVSQSVSNSSIKPSSAWLDIKLTQDAYFCLTKQTFRYRRVGTTDWTYGDTVSYSVNNSVRRISVSSLAPSTGYEWIFTTVNCSGVVSEYSYSFTTPAGLAAPTVSPLTGYGGCAEVGINSFSVIPQSGDTAVVYWVIKDPSWTVWEIYDSIIITKSTNLSGFSITVPASTTVDLGVQTKSKDGILSAVSSVRVTSFTSGNGSVNRELVSTDTASAVFEVFGNLDCSDSATVRCKIWKGTDLVTQRDMRVGRGSSGNSSNFNLSNVSFTGLQPGTQYHMEVGIFITQWIGLQSGGDRYFTTKPKSSSGGSGGGGTSSITTVTNTNVWSDDQLIVAYDLSGRSIKGTKIQLKNSLQADQVFIFTIEKNQKLEVVKTTPASL